MKIACVVPDYLSGVIFCKALNKALIANGYLPVKTLGPLTEAVKPEKSELLNHIDIPMKRWVAPLDDIKYFLALVKIFKEEKYDIVISFTTKPNIFVPMAARIAGIKNITMAVRGLGQLFVKNKTIKQLLLFLIVNLFYFVSARISKNIWFTNPEDKRFFEKFLFVEKKKVFLTKNAISLDEYCTEALDEQKLANLNKWLLGTSKNQVVLMVARLIWSKGIREFVEASRILHSIKPDIKFVLIAPEETASTEAVPVEFLNAAENDVNFIWLGFRSDVKYFYSICDVSVLPSYYKEGGYPRALIEAMSFGKPVIAADTPDCRLPVQDGLNGFIVPAKNSKILAEKILFLLSDKPLQSAMGEKSLCLANSEYDDRKVIALLLERLELPNLRGINK